MKIIEKSYKWSGGLAARNSTEYIILHHRAGDGDADSIHRSHIENGWSGIGYHFYVRKDGSIYRGRPQETVGAHCIGHNIDSVGVCFEGNWQTERNMPAAQLKAGRELVGYLRRIYPGAQVVRHGKFFATACPGQFFPFDELKSGGDGMERELTSANDLTWELAQRIEINDVAAFVAALEKAKLEESPLYWGIYKIVNKG